MPGIHIDLSQEDYDKIPRPKRAWVRKIIEASLSSVVGRKETDTPDVVSGASAVEDVEAMYYFRVGEAVYNAMGKSPKDASLKLPVPGSSIDLLGWKTEAEAIEAGWINLLE